MHYLIYTFMWTEVQLHAFLNSALGGGELSGLPLCYFTAVLHRRRRCAGPKPVGSGENKHFLVFLQRIENSLRCCSVRYRASYKRKNKRKRNLNYIITCKFTFACFCVWTLRFYCLKIYYYSGKCTHTHTHTHTYSTDLWLFVIDCLCVCPNCNNSCQVLELIHDLCLAWAAYSNIYASSVYVRTTLLFFFILSFLSCVTSSLLFCRQSETSVIFWCLFTVHMLLIAVW